MSTQTGPLHQVFKKLLVQISLVDDVSTVTVSPKLASELMSILPNCNAIRISKRYFSVFATMNEDESLTENEIGLGKQIRINLRASISDYVYVTPVDLQPFSSIIIRPFRGSGVTGNFIESFLKPHFFNNHRPTSKGTTFSCTAGIKKVYFKVCETSPRNNNGQGGIVDNETKLLLEAELDEDHRSDFIGYSDIGGQKSSLIKIREMIELPLMHPELFSNLGIKTPTGVLLFGPPGTGKTTLARAIASETGTNFIVVNGPELMSKMVGESEKNLRQVFEYAKKQEPSIIFMDEIDSIAPKRDKSTQETDKRMVSMLLTLMDGINKSNRVIVLAATNRPNSLDPALRRFGRFDREIEVGVPGPSDRLEILKIHTKNIKMDDDVDLQVLAEKTHGSVGADIAQLCTEAVYNCVRSFANYLDLDCPEVDASMIKNMKVEQKHFLSALKNIEPSALRETAIQSPDVSWEDIGGMQDLKEEMKEMVQYPLQYPDIYSAYGQAASKGCLLWGPPGCGKTMLAKAIATECEANFISVKGPELLTMWVGESESNVRSVFERARAASPCIIFFDEIDSLAQKRGSSSGDSGVGDRVMNAILLEMDGMNPAKQVFVIGATNRPDILDPALIRPGRLDSLIYVGLPDRGNREKVFEVHLKKSPLESDIDFRELAMLTDGFSCADISGLSKVAAKNSIRKAMSDRRDGKKVFEDGFPPITRKNIVDAIRVTKPSVSIAEIQNYLNMKQKYSSGSLNEVKVEGEDLLQAVNQETEKNKKN